MSAQDTTAAQTWMEQAQKALAQEETADQAFALFIRASEAYWNARAYDRWVYAIEQSLQAVDDSRADSLLFQAFSRKKAPPASRVQLHRLQGELLQNRGNWAEAGEQFLQGLALAEKTEGAESLAAARLLNALGDIKLLQTNIAEGVSHFERVVSIRRRHLGERHRDYTQALNNLGTAYRLAGRFEESAGHQNKAIAIGAEILPKEDPEMASYLNNAGVLARERGRYREAIGFYHRALPIFRLQGKTGIQNLAITSNNIAVSYKALGDHAQAAEYYQQALVFIQEAVGPDHPFVATILDNLGTGLAATGDFTGARNAHSRALAIRRRHLKENHMSLAASYYNLSNDYRRLSRFDSALAYGRLALDRYRAVSGKDNARSGLSLFNLGQIYISMDRLSDAEASYQEALAVQRALLPDNHPDLAQTNLALGELFLKQKDFPAASRQFQAALDRLLPAWRSFRKEGRYLEPIPFYPPLFYFKALRGLAEARAGEGKAASAIPYCRLMFQVLDSIRAGYRFEGSKIELAAQVRPHIEWSLEWIHQLEREKKADSLHALAFQWMEKSRSFLLYESLLAGKAFRDGRVPERLQQREQELRGDLAFYEKKIAEEEQKEDQMDRALIQSWRKLLLDRRQEYERLSIRLEKDYPAYYRLRRGEQPVQLKEVQQWLPDEETALISYWAGDSALFALLVLKKETRFIKLPNNASLNEQIERLRACIYKPFLGPQPAVSPDWGEYPRLAADLYARLLKPLGRLPQRIIILADGRLGHLPFDVLLTSRPTPEQQPRNWPFLLRSHQLSYAWSASLLLSLPSPRGRPRLLAFAPRFPAGTLAQTSSPSYRGDLGPLAFNEPEALSLRKYFPGKVLVGPEAGELQFRKMAPRFRLLHIASHARANDEEPLLSHIAFSPQAGDSLYDNRLEVAELYALPLTADLVVLSACETGTGVLRQGEGIYSLSRAFAYAGARSLLSTLWQVDDAATASLMESFYRYLRDGRPKDEALRLAQLDYLNGADPLHAHPFYWGGYVLTGNADPLPGPLPSPWVLAAGVAAALGFLFWRVGRRKNQSK